MSTQSTAKKVAVVALSVTALAVTAPAAEAAYYDALFYEDTWHRGYVWKRVAADMPSSCMRITGAGNESLSMKNYSDNVAIYVYERNDCSSAGEYKRVMPGDTPGYFRGSDGHLFGIKSAIALSLH